MATSSPRLPFFLFCALAHLTNLTIGQPDFFRGSCVDSSGNYTTNSAYHANLNYLLSSISSNSEINYGFYNFSAGRDSDKVNAIALCRGDVTLDKCRSCIDDAGSEILQVCPNRKEAIGWYDNCTLRYSNHSIFGTVETDEARTFSAWSDDNVLSVDQFNHVLMALLHNLTSEAASGDSLRKFASGNASAPAFKTLFALVQCTPDLSSLNCRDCLTRIFKYIEDSKAKEGGRVLSPSCNLRYEIYSFFEPTADDAPTPPSPPPLLPPLPSKDTEGKDNNASRTVMIIVVPAVAFVILIISICIFFRMRKSKKKTQAPDEIGNVESLQYDFNTIRLATNNFSDANKLGRGGFGVVYKGTLSNGQDIAVKRLSKDSGQGDSEFKNEVVLVAKLQHRNLVRLLGFSFEGNERLLIYEFVPNTSLDRFIFDSMKRNLLDWERRCKIIRGIARGLLYLHEDSLLRVIHRDLKTGNILLDAEMNPKIADFGMARLFEMDQTQDDTSKIVGTYGYMAPEYAIHGQFSVKTDVFSFGLLILEIISGLKNTCSRNGETVENLQSCAWKHWREGTTLNIVDPTLKTGSRIEMIRCIHIGLLCVQENAADRPTMASVVFMLNCDSFTLLVPLQPAFFMHSSIESDMSFSQNHNLGVTDSSQSKGEVEPSSANEASITDLYPR